jgi:hypothetical protein
MGRDTKNIFGPDAPDARLSMPQGHVILASEIIAFLPNSLRNHDVLLRLLQNGLTQTITANMVNHFRYLPKSLLPNSLCKGFQSTMRSCSGYGDWTLTSHQSGTYGYDFEWDTDDLTLTGVTLQCEIFPKHNNQGAVKNLRVEGVPFADLANGVASYPSIADGDGHDLTRCVQYCVAHPDKNYIFPRDFSRLAKKLGELPVSERNTDRAVFERWTVVRDRQTESVEDTEDSKVADMTDDEASDDDRVANDKPLLEGFEHLAAHAYLYVSSPLLYPQLLPHAHQQLPEFESLPDNIAYNDPASYFIVYDQMHAATLYSSEAPVGNDDYGLYAGPVFGDEPYAAPVHDTPANSISYMPMANTTKICSSTRSHPGTPLDTCRHMS